MSQYEARLERDLGRIRVEIRDLAEAVQVSLETASRALFAGDHELSYSVCLGDHPINRASRALDKACHGFIAVHLPSAGHLRYISAVMRANLELERVGAAGAAAGGRDRRSPGTCGAGGSECPEAGHHRL